MYFTCYIFCNFIIFRPPNNVILKSLKSKSELVILRLGQMDRDEKCQLAY